MAGSILIAGIDPGTTLAYALLDTDGNFIALKSSKHTSIGKLIFEMHQYGTVLLVGTDKAKVPGLVAAAAHRLGARAVSPREDLKVDEKRTLVRGMKTTNAHESDALASALFAYNQYHEILNRIRDHLDRDGKKPLFAKTASLVIKNGFSIHHAVELLERPDEKSTIIVEKALNEPQRMSNDDLLYLSEQLLSAQKDLKWLKLQNRHLQQELLMRGQREKRTPKEKPDYKTMRIRFLRKETSDLQEKLRRKEEEYTLFAELLGKYSGYPLAKRLHDFSTEEFERKNRVLHFRQGDIIFVDNPNIFSLHILDRARSLFDIILYREQPHKNILEQSSFHFVAIDRVLVKELNAYFAVIDPEKTREQAGSFDRLQSLVREYQKRITP